jgi:hypothetical protein
MVIVIQPAQNRHGSQRSVGNRCLFRFRRGKRSLSPDPLMGPAWIVITINIFLKQILQMLFIERDNMIE